MIPRTCSAIMDRIRRALERRRRYYKKLNQKLPAATKLAILEESSENAFSRMIMWMLLLAVSFFGVMTTYLYCAFIHATDAVLENLVGPEKWAAAGKAGFAKVEQLPHAAGIVIAAGIALVLLYVWVQHRRVKEMKRLRKIVMGRSK